MRLLEFFHKRYLRHPCLWQMRRISFVLSCIVASVVFAALAGPEKAYSNDVRQALDQLDLEAPRGIPSELKEIGVTEHLGAQVSISDLEFRDEFGKTISISDYFNRGRPIILNLVYYECPNLCGFLLNGFLSSLKKLSWTAGQEFEIITLSINPKEKPELALAKKGKFIDSYARPQAASGWHFLTGEESQIKKLATQVGFHYRYDEQDRQYAHSAALFVLTPQGRISRYLYGIEFLVKDLRLSLLEASNGKIGTVVDRMLLFCYRYDPKTRKYSIYLTRLMQAGGGSTVVVFGSYLAMFWRRQRKIPEGPANQSASKGTDIKEPNSHV